MKRSILVVTGLTLLVGLGLTIPLRAAIEDDQATMIAKQVTTAGAAMFSAKDAKGLAATYQENAQLIGIERSKEGTIRLEIKQGRGEIQAFYESLFKDDAVFHARNTVEHARKIEPDLLLITGTFEPDAEAAEIIKIPFTQIRQREGNDWRIVSLQIVVSL